MPHLPEATRAAILAKLGTLYGDRAGEVLERVDDLAGRYADLPRRDADGLWDETDAVLITYGDQVRGDGVAALEAQRVWLLDQGFGDLLSAVHILPFSPYSSDDGFSVIDYRAVDPDVGDWPDVERLREDFDLAFDLVLNHCSAKSEWFGDYQAGREPYTRYFIEVDPGDDRLAMVTRPRALPLLTPVATDRGERHVWTTFSADQVDLNFAEPDVLLDMLDVLLGYVKRGARVVRQDAIAYLWKRLGTTCIHLPETHTVVKLMRDLLDAVAPGTLILTETNVPHAENVSYFGGGDEAHMVYNFSLAPLLLDALLTGDGTHLNAWLTNLSQPGDGMTYFNFTASHDGVGVRPLEGLVPTERVAGLVAAVEDRGGRVSTKANADGTVSPYELNITYFSALSDPAGDGGEDAHLDRFIASQAVMLSLKGIPGIYFHSLVGTQNWTEGVAETQRSRTINRRKFTREELDNRLRPGTPPRAVLDRYRDLLRVRTAQPAFHPAADQEVLDLGPDLVAFVRTSEDAAQRIVCLTNLTGEPATADLSAVAGYDGGRDLLSGGGVGKSVSLDPWAVRWLAAP